MEIPLVLRSRSGGALVYSISTLFRAGMAAITAILAAALFIDGSRPGLAGWIAIAASALAALYEERWLFDPASGRVVHRAGLLILARSTTIELSELALLRILPFVRGTLPGSEDEAIQNAAALEGSRGDDRSRRRSWHKKPFLCLVLETRDGSRYSIEVVPARKAAALKARAARMAEACGRELVEGYSGS
jgi:hypothetical protein